MPIEKIDAKSKNKPEVLKIIKRCRAKGEDDDGLAKVYEAGEEIRIKGSGKLTLLAMGLASRDLNAKELEDKNFIKQQRAKGNIKDDADTPKVDIKNLNNLKGEDLDIYLESLGLVAEDYKTKPAKIAAIKNAVK